MASGLTMDHSVVSRSVWTSGDSRFLQPPADLYTSVVVTRSIPAGTSFGPCVLQNTFYDTIAFIAQKSCDKRTKSYVFKVDPEAMRSSVLVLSWLRLVQAARNPEEQNAEAYLKAGQLHVRTTREVLQDQELLVWYDPELSHLLGFSDMSTRQPGGELRCTRCNQTFKNEHPYLAHCRFLCVQAKNEAWSREAYDEKHAEIKKPRRVTDFHNIARDLEHKRCGSDDDGADASSKKRKHEDIVYPKGRKSVLLEKTNISNDDNITQLDRDYHQPASAASASILKLKADRFKTDHLECKNSGFVERDEAGGNFTHDTHDRTTDAIRDTEPGGGERSSSSSSSSGLGSTNNSSAFTLVLSGPATTTGEQKSAFCKPRKRTSSESTTTATLQLSTTTPPAVAAMVDVFTPRTVLGATTYGNLLASSTLSGELQQQSARSAPTSASAFHYAHTEHWSRRVVGAQLQASASAAALTVLPPTFTSFGVSVQNWCAKCNLSFRMTSDLVFHMRSHHKKEFAAESQVRRRREEKLTCPICHEYFRERHHLSRHMTSHN